MKMGFQIFEKVNNYSSKICNENHFRKSNLLKETKGVFMMKGRYFTSGLILLLAALVVGLFVFFSQKIEVSASATVFVNQTYNVHFSHQLDEKSTSNGGIYVTNINGEKVDAQISMQPNQQSLSIVHGKPGNYVLHVEKKAFKHQSVAAKKEKFEYQVIEKLKSIASIEELESYFQTLLNREKRYNIGAVEESADMVNAETSSSKSAGADGSHSETNNQVEGIEEGDIVTTDDQYIYAIIDQSIVITDTKNPRNLKQVGKISFKENSYPIQLMTHDNILIAVYDQYIELGKSNSSRYYAHGTSMTKAAFYNIDNPKKPKLIREIGQEGYMNGVRKTDDNLYIITNKTPEYWIMAQEDVELRPYTFDSNESKEVKPMEMEDIAILPGTMEPNYTIISAIDLNNFNNKQVETKGFLGGSSTLYMSQDALYLTAVNYTMPETFKSSEVPGSSTSVSSLTMPVPMTLNTDLYKFAIDGIDVTLVANTSVKGSVLNQFSMDEYNGFFRIATTEGHTWGANADSKNHLFIFDEKLKKIGELTDLAKGERIYSARFMGDKAYVVTFKQVDPLFVIDVANPEKPKVLGELKIPGFSNYLHPLDENHLIGIGYDTESRIDEYTKEPFVTTKGMKVSLFDITDFENPKEQDSVIIGGRGTHSEIQYNHKALFRNGTYSYYGFPITIYEGKGEYDIQYKGSGAVVYEITAENGIQLKGNLVTPAKPEEQYEDWNSLITRLVYINESLYTVSRNEIKSYNLQNFNELDSLKLN